MLSSFCIFRGRYVKGGVSAGGREWKGIKIPNIIISESAIFLNGKLRFFDAFGGMNNKADEILSTLPMLFPAGEADAAEPVDKKVVDEKEEQPRRGRRP